MLATHAPATLTAFVVGGVLVFGLACTKSYDPALLEGTWHCTTNWTAQIDGKDVPCSYVQEATLKDNKASAKAVLSIGAAQWDETVQSTYVLSGDEVHDTRTAVRTVPKNDAARQFEQDRFDGQNIAVATKSGELNQDFRITTLTETEAITVDHQGRISTCRRPSM